MADDQWKSYVRDKPIVVMVNVTNLFKKLFGKKEAKNDNKNNKNDDNKTHYS
jgi:hypothetical protein